MILPEGFRINLQYPLPVLRASPLEETVNPKVAFLSRCGVKEIPSSSMTVLFDGYF
jgi:hypothetical protein